MGTNHLLRCLIPADGDLDALDAVIMHVNRMDTETINLLSHTIDRADVDDTHRRRLIDAVLDSLGDNRQSLRIRWAHRYAIDAADAASMIGTSQMGFPVGPARTYLELCGYWSRTRLDVWSAIVALAHGEGLEHLTRMFLFGDEQEPAVRLLAAPRRIMMLLAERIAECEAAGDLPDTLYTLPVIDAVAEVDRDTAVRMLGKLSTAAPTEIPIDVRVEHAVDCIVSDVLPIADPSALDVVFTHLRAVPWALWSNSARFTAALGCNNHDVTWFIEHAETLLADGTPLSELLERCGSSNPPTWEAIESVCTDDMKAAVMYELAANPTVPVDGLVSHGCTTALRTGFRKRRNQDPESVIAVAKRGVPVGGTTASVLTFADVCADLPATLAELVYNRERGTAHLSAASELSRMTAYGVFDDDVIAALNTGIFSDVDRWVGPVTDRLGTWISHHIGVDRVELASELAGTMTLGELAATVAD